MDGENNSATESSKSKAYTVSATEEKELRRVYDRLCDFQVRSRINDEIKDLQAWQHNARMKVKESLAVNIIVDQNQVEQTHTATQSRIDELKQKLHELESNPLKSISLGDVADMFKKLGVKVNKKEVEEMIWEVDEDLNSRVDWSEFRLMYIRNVNDKTGLEPSRLYSLAQFMIYDINGNGHVSVDETMNILYHRYGKAKMEVKIREIFGERKDSGLEGGEICFAQFLASFQKSQEETYWNTPQGKLVASKLYGDQKLDKQVKKEKV